MRSTLLEDWNWVALKGESGGVTRIVVKTLRFVNFLVPDQIKTARSWAASNVLKVADSISAHCFFYFTFDIVAGVVNIIIWRHFWENWNIFMQSTEW